jgi:hypothetical protein
MAGLPELLWCATPAEVAVLARHGRLRAAIVDALIARLDPGLLAVVRRACPVLVVDGRPDARRWEALGAVVLRETPPSATEALASVERAEASWRSAPGAAVKRLEPVRRGSLVAVLAAPGGSATPTAVAVAGSLADATTPARTVALADLSLRAPHRALHGIGSEHAGLPDLLEASRFGHPPPASILRSIHVVDRGYLVVPGLEQHHDWVLAGDVAAARALDGLRATVDLTVAQVDPDLEGEIDTGSFDIEDRNVLARTAVRAADLVLVAAGSDRYGRLGAIAALTSLARHGVPHERTVVLLATGRVDARRLRGRLQPGRGRHGHPIDSGQVLAVRRDRADRALGRALLARIAEVGPGDATSSRADAHPRPVESGELGHWRQDIEGWMTPRAPQQP